MIKVDEGIVEVKCDNPVQLVVETQFMLAHVQKQLLKIKSAARKDALIYELGTSAYDLFMANNCKEVDKIIKSWSKEKGE